LINHNLSAKSSIVLSGFTAAGWNSPPNLSFDNWCNIGAELGCVETTLSWAVGDWWANGENCYGKRRQVVSSDDWPGPSFTTCMNIPSVCRRFETDRRREVLRFGHHREVASLPPAETDELLDRCAEPIAEGGKPHKIAELRQERQRREQVLTESAMHNQPAVVEARPQTIQDVPRLVRPIDRGHSITEQADKGEL
jgi:hypothetical protein